MAGITCVPTGVSFLRVWPLDQQYPSLGTGWKYKFLDFFFLPKKLSQRLKVEPSQEF